MAGSSSTSSKSRRWTVKPCLTCRDEDHQRRESPNTNPKFNSSIHNQLGASVMAGDLDRLYERESIGKDERTIWQNMQYEEKKTLQKRLFLMGLSDTDTLDEKGELPVEFLPESLLRKDDIFYEDLEKTVEMGFGINKDMQQQHASHDFVEFRDRRHMSRVILGLLDDFTNSALLSLAKIVSKDSFTSEKTRPQMEKVIRKSLEVMQSKQDPSKQVEIQSQVSQLLGNPKNFRKSVKHLNMTLKSHRDSVMKVLDGLGDMPTPALKAMSRKLKGVRYDELKLHPNKSESKRDRLIDQVKSMCLEMIGQLGDSDVLPETLVKAMGVASFNFMLKSGYEDLSLIKFVHSDPEKEDIQNEIFKAIHVVSHMTKKNDKEKLFEELGPEFQKRYVGTKSIRNWLVECLYESSDMDKFPDLLLRALRVINEKSTRRLLSKDLIQKDVEEVLNLSAAIRHVLLDSLPPNYEFDEDFTEAYMEDLVESDDGNFFDDDDEGKEEEEEGQLMERMDGVEIRLNDFNEEVHSTGDPYEGSLGSSSEGNSSCASRHSGDECMDTGTSATKMLLPPPPSSPPLDGNDTKRQFVPYTPLGFEQNPVPECREKSRNRYVAIQEISDEASLSMYRLIGNMVDRLAKAEGLELGVDNVLYLRGGQPSLPQHSEDPPKGKCLSDVVVPAILEVMPSFPAAELEKVKKFLSS